MSINLKIDLIDLADTGQPVKHAELLMLQLAGQVPQLLPTPVEDLARACGITEFNEFTVAGFEGGLIQNSEKTAGIIMVKAGARNDRRRFTIAHELGHFVNPYHLAPGGEAQLLCTSKHLQVSGSQSDRRLGIEAQANEFAANLLMPERQLRAVAKLWGSPEIQSILNLQTLCFVSKEAAARRFLDLHGDPCAVVFSRDGQVRYSIARGGFPAIELREGHPVHSKTLTATYSGQPGAISDQDECDPFLWLDSQIAREWEMWEEVLIQQDGFRMTLLVAERSSHEEDEELSDRWTPRFRK